MTEAPVKGLRVSPKRQWCGVNPLLQKCMSTAAVAQTRPLPLVMLTEEELAMKETVAKLAQQEIAPYVKKMDETSHMDPAVVEMLFQNGLMGIEIDEKYGGTGGNFMVTCLVVEELAKVDPAVATLVCVHNTLVCSLMKKVASEEQKEKYLPILAQKNAGSFCLTEPTSGSDAFGLKTVAKKDGDEFIINGSKMWISNSDIAEVFLVFANADTSQSYRGITTFIVERSAPGLSVAKKEDKLGIRASGTCMVHFDNVRVHKSMILGEYGQGYKYAAGFLNEGRIAIGSQMLGCSQGCFDLTIPYTLERKQFSKSIYEFQSMQHQIAEIATKIEAARLLVYNAARLVENNQPYVKEASMAKLYATEIAHDVTRKCIDWMGGVGFTKDFPQEKFYRDCKIGTIYEGTSNMQLSTIAKYIKNQYKIG
ncbi:UNVERIFIED_CONTAM: hypothetical protein PYX00_007397 [Menopon gallinae]|uniref:Short/branched chain specific acyl-CoA dehydrogenase, mitochondrial n=1 Tax=Menopon gallinae TaxID=328185 RepID=A0AAW2HJU1_9NEOP